MALSPAQLSELEAWLSQYELAVADLDQRTVAATWAAYSQISDWTNPTQTLAAAAAASGTAQTARQLHLGLMGQYMSNVLEIFTGRRPSTPRTDVGYSRNADPFDVYSRPVFAARDAIANGIDEEFAKAEAEQLAEVLSLTDALLARRDAAYEALVASERVTHYRRVIRPELSETGTCGLCIAAAAKAYSVEDLLPIHTRCKCTVLPILGADDPGEQFNLSDIRGIYAQVPATRRQELSTFRYTVEDLAELGPVLTPAVA